MENIYKYIGIHEKIQLRKHKSVILNVFCALDLSKKYIFQSTAHLLFNMYITTSPTYFG